MSALAIRRFPERITRRRQGTATFNLYGEPESGAMVETVLAASVQPLKLSDADIAGGVSLVERLQVYVRESDALTAAFEDRQADTVVVDGKSYVVEESRSWPGRHCRATILRAT